jgi:hypothetical protein
MPRAWLAELEQPAVIRANPTSYDFYWRAYPLDVRSVDDAYTIEEYRTFPAVPVGWIDRFEDWFTGLADRVRVRRRQLPGVEEFRADETVAAISHLSEAANDFGLTLPDRFANFFGDECHPLLFPSNSYDFNFPERIVPASECPEAGLIRFYSDPQGTMHWYLYLTPEGDECVVASDAEVGGRWAEHGTSGQRAHRYQDDDVGRTVSFCAPSFAEFIVRSWLEAMAWCSLNAQSDGPEMARWAQAPEVRAYLDHYRK